MLYKFAFRVVSHNVFSTCSASGTLPSLKMSALNLICILLYQYRLAFIEYLVLYVTFVEVVVSERSKTIFLFLQ